MNRRIRDLTGRVFGRLTIFKFSHIDKHGFFYWLCQCECDGKTKIVLGQSLTSGKTRSCGCLRRELASKRMEGKKSPNYKHGLSKTSFNARWLDMNKRCTTNPNSHYYKYYGGRGITVCWRWHKDNPKGFESFRDDMYASYLEYKKTHTKRGATCLHRKNNDENYCPSNCVWLTHSEHSTIHGHKKVRGAKRG